MAGLDTTTASAALKEDYLPVIREQLNNINVVLSQIEKNQEDSVGTEAVLSLHVSRNSGVGARADGGALPTAGNQGYVKSTIPLRRNYGSIRITGPVIRAMKSDAGSWTRAVESESKGIVTDLKRDVNRQVNGQSTGQIITCGASGPSATVQLATGTAVKYAMRQLYVGQFVDIGTVASPTSIASNRKITAVDRVNNTITISGANVTVTSANFVFNTGSGGSGASQVELTGLQTIVKASGTLQGVDPATYDSWVSYSDSNGGTTRTPTDTLWEKAMDEANIASGVNSWLIVTSHGVARNYAAQLTAQKRFNDTVDLKGGFKGLTVSTALGEASLTTDRDTPNQTAFGLSTEHLIEFEASDWEFMDEDGAVLSRDPGYDAYVATLFRYHEVATDMRNAHFVVSDLAEA